MLCPLKSILLGVIHKSDSITRNQSGEAMIKRTASDFPGDFTILILFRNLCPQSFRIQKYYRSQKL